MPRPELRNHGVGWMRAVERLRNGGVPRNPVFLMPATHCRNLDDDVDDTRSSDTQSHTISQDTQPAGLPHVPRFRFR